MPARPIALRVRHVLDHADSAAAEMKMGYVGTEHLLLGLLREQGGMGAHILMRHGLTEDVIRRDIDDITKSAPGRPPR